MKKKGKKLKLKIKALNVIKDVDQRKIGGGLGDASGTGPTFPCDPQPWSLWNCTRTEASGCWQCPTA